MKIEGASQQTTSYKTPSPEPVKIIKEHVEPVKVVEDKRTSNLEIVDYTRNNPGYKPTIQEKLIMESIETANRKILGPEKEFEFAIHKETKQIMVKVLDKNTQEVLREIPPEKVLDAVARMCEIAGIFMDEKR